MGQAPPPCTVQNVDTAEGLAWLRAVVIDFIAAHPGVTEDAILAHVEASTPEDYEGASPDFRAVDLLADLVIKDRALRWDEQNGRPDAPLRYWIVADDAPTAKGRGAQP